MPQTLIVDDDVRFVQALSSLVEHEGFQVSTASSLQEAHGYLERMVPDVALIDLMLGDGDGIDLIRELAMTGATKLIVVTGYAGVDNTVEALRAGVVDVLTKPLDVRQLREQLGAIREELAATTAADIGRSGLSRLGKLIGSSPSMQTIYGMILKAAPSDATVLIYGESGTGKELVAEAICSHSRRSEQPFVALNCAAVPPNLIGSELFGHERGAFTDAHQQHKGCFERAEGGTLFLDEITEMPLELQVQLLRVLESRTVRRLGGVADIPIDVRIIAATNRPPKQAIADGRLREDLMFRLMVFPIHMPPLRQRGNDVIELAEHFLAELNASEETDKRLSRSAREHLARYSWPGNVRELRNAIQYAYILADDQLQAEHFPREFGSGTAAADSSLSFVIGTPISDFESRFVLATLDHYHGDKKLAAETLGVSLKTLYNKLSQYQKT
jgi:DNA-binding NtrC family response regulator